ncbi:secretin [Deinococcus koreensis]|uniref:Secretin n=2 Tax=Deinococcus koreensis TaxID=2054903 RepID=A0A2K3V0A7_9DEIO|nr:secretin [Deinococcus koreensis]
MAAAQTSTPAAAPAAGTAVADRGLSSAAVTFEIRRSGSDLTSVLVALAKSAGYDLIIEPNADEVLRTNSVASSSPAPAGSSSASAAAGTTVSYAFSNKPFNEVWPLVLDIYGLSYESLNIGGKTVLRVGLKPIQRIVKLPATLEAGAVERQLKLSFGTLRPATAQATQQGSGPATATSSQEEIVLDSTTMRIVAEPSSNSVIIRGTNQEVAQIERLLSQIVAAQGTPGAAPTQAQRIYSVKSSQADVVTLLGTQFPTLRVAPFGQSGQIVITGPQSQLDAALSLLGQVDRAPAPAAAAPATSQQVYTVKGAQADAVAVLGAQFPALKITPVGQTGQLVINGPQDQLTAALGLLAQVDRPAAAAPGTIQKVFTLVNASAEEIKATLEGTLARELATGDGTNLVPGATLINPLTGQPYTSGALANAPVSASTGAQTTANAPAGTAAPSAGASAVTIIADKRTNTVIVRGTAEQVAQVGDLIPRLDVRVPQINVQVRIQEITETAARSLGVDWNLGFGGFNVSAGKGGLTAAFDPTKSLVGFNLGPTLNTLQNQGLSKSVYDGAVTMQSGQRSLGSSTDTQNSSSSAAASIKSGGRLELNIPSVGANVPPIQKQIDYGVNLDFFSPQVAPDGSITLRVRGQINDLTTVINNSTVPNLLQFTNSEAQTTLTLKNGETVLLSGLLKTKETQNNDGVPFLSSLPVVGALFGKQSTRKEQTQLLVVITGTIVQ